MDSGSTVEPRAVRVDPAVLAWAFGYGVFLAFVGAAVVAPPDPLTQLSVAIPLLGLVVPIVYRVLDADDVGRHDVTSRRPLPYLVGTTLASTAAVSLVPVPADPMVALLARLAVFLTVFGLASWAAISLGRDRTGPVTPE